MVEPVTGGPSDVRGRAHEIALAALLGGACVAFALASGAFATAGNLFEILRAGGELGLIALGMTLVVATGGIDLSVGAMIGLSGVVLGKSCAAGVPFGAAALAALVAGAAGGALNGLLVGVRGVPPLVATLGTMALFRGLAEGITGGYEVYGAWPEAFLALGQGYAFGWLPPQVIVLAAAGLLAAAALHRAPFGRRLLAVGLSADAARHAGVPVPRTLVSVYALSGAAAALAGGLMASHLGQARADAGSGWELAAVTVVVLGGTSIQGGRASVAGTMLGLLTVAVLRNGLLLAGLPEELGGMCLGALLVGAVLLGNPPGHGAATLASRTGRFQMKNTQVAAIVVAILLGAGAIAGSNWLLVRSLGGPRPDDGFPGRASERRLTVAVLPKSKSDPYFVSCREGAEAAARELEVDLIWDGPTETDAARQVEVVEAWITRGVDVIAASVENREALSSVLRKARGRGIRVLTWDADADAAARDFLVNQATPEGIGTALADEAGRILDGKGAFAIVTATVTAANQNEWIRHIRARLAERWPGLEIAVVRPSDGLRDKALTETANVLRAYPGVRLIVAIAAPAVLGAAEAVKQAGSDVKVTGLSVPSLCRSYVHEGIVESIVLWNTVDLGYLTIHAAAALARGSLRAGDQHLDAGRLGRVQVAGDEIILGKPFRFDRTNIDRFRF